MRTDADTSTAKVFRLHAGDSTLVLLESKGVLGIAHFGAGLHEPLNAAEFQRLHIPLVPHGELDTRLFEPLVATEDGLPQKHPALIVRRDARSLNVNLSLYECRHTGSSLHVSLHDKQVGLELTVAISGASSGIFRWSSTARNTGSGTLEIDWLASATLVLPTVFQDVQANGGFWANELQSQRSCVGRHSLVFSSERGRSSHQSSPSLLIGEAHFGDNRGEVVEVALEWSGNHQLTVAPGRSGDVLVQCGVPNRTGEIVLQPGEAVDAPAMLCAYSDSGINGLRDQFKRYWHQGLVSSDLGLHRPVHFNSWEACYFQHTETSIKGLIADAKDLGAERFVLDDGWMENRVGPGLGLGDWVACPERYPAGLGPVAEHARQLGMEFGLWVEPEMVTLDSRLANAHSEWIVAAPGHDPVAGRGQYLLNLTRADVRVHLAGTLDRLIAECRPDYLKWDMNRDYANTGSDSDALDNAMVRAWYDILDACRERHPSVAIEICAAGGARADAGALLRGERVWPSDSMDPIQRFSVLRSCSALLPPALLGWHVGSATSSTSGATLPLSTRCALATLGHMGLELDPAALNDADRTTVKYWVDFFKRERHWMASANYRFLEHPEPGRECLLILDTSGHQALLVLLQSRYPDSGTTACLRLPGLLFDSLYTIELLNPQDSAFVQDLPEWQREPHFTAQGESLVRHGIRQPYLQLGHCALFKLSTSPKSTVLRAPQA